MIDAYLPKTIFHLRKILPTILLLNVIWVIPINTAVAQNDKETFNSFRVVSLKNGPNEIDLNGDGLKDLAFIARRENFNAHEFDIITFYVYAKDATSTVGKWHLVPFFDEKGVPKELSYTTTESADCFLSDIRILRPKSSGKKPIQVVVGIRDFGESFADDAFVKFFVYELKNNKEGVPGEPLFYFQHTRTISAQNKYCDINEAFQKELGLEWHRSDNPQEWRR